MSVPEGRNQDYREAEANKERSELFGLCRARVDCGVRLQVKTDGPLTVIITGCGTYRF